MSSLVHFFLVVFTVILWFVTLIAVIAAALSRSEPKEKRETRGWITLSIVLAVASLFPLGPSLRMPLADNQYIMVIENGNARAFYKGWANLPFDPMAWIINWPAGERTLVVNQKVENIWSFEGQDRAIYASMVIDLHDVKPDLLYRDLGIIFPSDLDSKLAGNVRVALENKGGKTCEDTVSAQIAKFESYGIKLKEIVNCFKE